MTTHEAVAWGNQLANGDRTVNPNLVPELDGATIWPLTALEMVAVAVATDLLDAFERVGRRVGLRWSRADVHVTVTRRQGDRRISQITYQLRVVTDEATLAQIASHDLEHEAVVFASLAAIGHQSGVVVTAQTGHDR